MFTQRRDGWIGVDLGSHTVKVAQVVRHRSGPRLHSAMVVPRQQIWTGGSLSPQSSVDEILAALTLSGMFRGRKASCSLPMHLCGVHSFAIPPDEEVRRRELIARELQAVGGGGDGASLFDYWELQLPDAEARYIQENLVVLCLPEPWSWQVVHDLGEAGLRCQVLDGNPLALARAIKLLTAPPHQETIAAVDWGFTSATFSILRDGQVLFVRGLRDCGLSHIVQNLCENLGVSLEEAHLLLREHGLPPVTAESRGGDIQAALNDVVAEPLNALVEELSRTLSYLKVHRSSQRPTRLVLFGGGATMRNVAPVLTHKVQLPVDVWQPPAYFAPRELAANCPLELLGPAIGLSLLAWEDV